MLGQPVRSCPIVEASRASQVRRLLSHLFAAIDERTSLDPNARDGVEACEARTIRIRRDLERLLGLDEEEHGASPGTLHGISPGTLRGISPSAVHQSSPGTLKLGSCVLFRWDVLGAGFCGL